MKKISLVLFVIMLLCSLVVPGVALAEEVSPDVYTNVLDDLGKDESFCADNYVTDSNDFSLEVIQVAESDAKQLFVYVYNPSASCVARSINISTGINDNVNYENYNLRCLNSSGVFSKYLVEGFAVKADALRYYAISSIFRDYIPGRDPSMGTGQTTNEFAIAVGQTWTACTVDGNVTYSMETLDVVTIPVKVVAALSNLYDDFNKNVFSDDYGIYKMQYHYVAFSIDEYSIDDLLEVKLSYVETRHYGVMHFSYNLFDDTKVSCKPENKYGVTYPAKYVVLNSGDPVETPDGGKKYQWNEIESSKSFCDKFVLSNEEQVAEQDWVLSFASTSLICNDISVLTMSGNLEYSDISHVTILQLKFSSEGKTYNLGVVDNKQSPPAQDLTSGPQDVFDPDSWLSKIKAFFANVETFFVKVGIFLIVGALFALVVVLFKPFSKLLYWVLYGLYQVIVAPFRLVALIVNRIKERRSS